MIEFIKKNKEYSLIWFLLALSILNNLYSIEYFRIFYRDDVWTASYAYNFYKTGVNFDVMAREVGMILAHGSIVDYIYGFFMNMFPHSHLVHRYVSFVIGLYFLFILYKVFYFFIKDKLIVLKTVLFISLMEYFVLISHISRADILGVSVVFTAFYIFIKDNQKFNYFFSAFLLGVAFDIHLASLIGIFLFLGYEFIYKRWTFTKYKLYITTIVFYILGLSIWFITHYNEFDKVMESISFLESVSTEQSFFHRFTALYEMGIGSTYYRNFIFLLIFLSSLLFYILLRKKLDKDINKVFLIFLVAFIGYIILGRTSIFYLWYFFPLLYLFFIYSLNSFKFGKVIYYLFIIYHIIFWSMVYKKEHTANFDNYANKIEKICNNKINKKTLIIAPDDIWYIYRNHKFLSYNARVKFDSVIEKNKNILLVVNEPLYQYLKFNKSMGKATGVTAFHKNILKKYFRYIGEVKDYNYGSFGLKKKNTVRIYYKK